jgi:hypothetical protein
LRNCTARGRDIFAVPIDKPEGTVANKEQKRSNRETKKPKQKKKGADKRPAGKGPTGKA